MSAALQAAMDSLPAFRHMIMNSRTLLALLLGMAPICDAKNDEAPAVSPRDTKSATEVAAGHVRHFMKGDFDKMAESYAAKVRLMPGHEMLKAEYGLAGEGGRAQGATVDRARLRDAMKKAFGGRPVVQPDVLEKLWNAFEFQVLEPKPGDGAVDPPDPVDTPDGKVHFALRQDDLLLKFAPKNGKGDFLLFQLRAVGGGWKVVAELLD
jgi:hypothetical protein